MNIDLSSKVILVTGASRGIGLAIAETVLNCGAFVIMHYNKTIPPENLTKHKRVTPLQEDLSKKEGAERLFKSALKIHNKINVLVNNAGIAISSDPELNSDQWIDNWNETLTVNLTSAAILCKEAINHFKNSNSGGIIINITSRAAFRGDTKDYLAYAASKGGLMSLTRSIARAYGKDNILAYDIAPGFTRTEMAEQFIEEYGEEFAKADIALDDLTKPDDIAPMVAFLASGMARHATGTSIQMNAGSYVH